MLKKRVYCVLLLISLAFALSGCKSSDYKKAVAYYDNGKYDEAKQILDNISDYKDSAEYLRDIPYQKAVLLYDSGNYAEAYAVFKTLSGYKDVDQYIAGIKECGIIIRNAEIENEIGKKLYEKARQYANGITSTAASVGISGARVAEYEMVKDQTVDVRFNELSDYFAAVIEIRWAYDLFGKTT